MIELGNKVLHIPSNKLCYVVFINIKEPKYLIRFPNMHATDVYEVEVEEIEEAVLIASEPEIVDSGIGTEGVKVNKDIKKISEELK